MVVGYAHVTARPSTHPEESEVDRRWRISRCLVTTSSRAIPFVSVASADCPDAARCRKMFQLEKT